MAVEGLAMDLETAMPVRGALHHGGKPDLALRRGDGEAGRIEAGAQPTDEEVGDDRGGDDSSE